MKTVTESITPDMASSWLAKNNHNRNLSASLVAKYARSMLSGDWSLTHQGIAFYDDGSLADGQHRLNAIVISGVTVKMQVAYGVPRTSGADIDVHRARDASDAVRIGQLSDWVAKDAIAITRIIAVNGDKLNIREIVHVCESHRDDYQFVIGLFTTRKRFITSSPIMGAMVMASVAGAPRNALARFASCLMTGMIDGAHESSAIRLREYCISAGGAAQGGRVLRIEMCLRAQRAIKAFVDGQSISKLMLPSVLIYPQLVVNK